MTIALSTTEAQYVVATHATKQILWHHALFNELKIVQPKTSVSFSDNQPAISISHHLKFHAYTKHIDIAHHFLCDLVKSGVIEVIYIQTCKNLVDLFTKGLSRPLHDEFTYEIIQPRGNV